MISEETVAQVATLLPQPDRSVLAIAPPGTGPGTWAGAPSAARGDTEIYLAYRLRRPQGRGRGYAVVVARSADGVHFETILTIGREELGAESLERPAIVPAPDGGWRLYLSCATPGSKHWRVEMLEAQHPGAFDARRSRMVLPGDAGTAVKDPVIVRDGDLWHLWASVHPLTDPDQTDRMATDYACSSDGLSWAWQGTALSPRPGEWDARGVRVTAVRSFAGQRRRVLRRAGHGDGKLRGADRCRGWRSARVTDRARPDRPVAVPGRGPALSLHPRPRRLPRALLLRDDAGGRSARAAHRVPLTTALTRSKSGGGLRERGAGRCAPGAGPRAWPRPARPSRRAAAASRRSPGR